jgi:flagellar export protein FliJ
VKPFRFRLESVLRHSGRRRDQAQAERCLALARLHALENELIRFKESEARRSAERSGTVRLRAHDLQQAGARKLWFDQQCMQLVRKIQDAARQLHDKEKALRLAQRECRKFELLKDRRQKAWLLDQEKIAQKQTDEIASQGHSRRAAAA